MAEISVVIPARDAERALPALLQSLRQQTLAPERFEVVVVENGSVDRTAEVAAAHGARVVRSAVANRSLARNAGVEAARSDLIAFTDADCVATPSWLEGLLACRGTAPLLAGRVMITTRPSPNAVERFERTWRFAQEVFARQGWAATANLCVERSAFEAVGGLDPGYRHIAEDADFCIRASRAGYSIAYCGEAVIEHAADDALTSLLKRSFFHGYSSAQAMRRIGVGHVAWRHPRPLISPNAALTALGVDPGALASRERRIQGALASTTYASRIAGSLWALARRAR
jgi:glycosyltransferase involved in cell wall biosynthesis